MALPINMSMSMTMTMDVKNMHATDAVAVLTNVRICSTVKLYGGS